MTTELTPGKKIFIRLGHATAHCAVGVTGVCGTVVDETEKAVHVNGWAENGKTYRCWLPKRALVKRETMSGTVHASLARWFRPAGWTSRWLELCAQSSMVAA